MSSAVVTQFAWPASLVLQAVWAFQIWRYSLHRRYPALVGYLILSTMLGCIGYALASSHAQAYGQHVYLWFFVASRPVMWLLFFAVLFECYSRMVDSYDGVRRIGQLVMYGGAGSVAAVLGLILWTNPYVNPETFWHRVMLVEEQSVYLGTAICIFLLVLLRRFFHLPIPRNVQAVFGAFGFYFSGMAALIVIRSYWGQDLTSLLDAGGTALYAICLLSGAWFFRSAGEAREADPRLSGQGRKEVLATASARLEHVNLQLLRALAK